MLGITHQLTVTHRGAIASGNKVIRQLSGKWAIQGSTAKTPAK
jgi:hypothetical protein